MQSPRVTKVLPDQQELRPKGWAISILVIDIGSSAVRASVVRPDGAVDEAIRAVEAELKLRESAQAAPRGEVEVLKARLAADANDHQARFDLALALDAGGDREGALNE